MTLEDIIKINARLMLQMERRTYIWLQKKQDASGENA